ELHDRLLPVRSPALEAPHPLELPLERRGPNRRDLDVEHRLDSDADLDLVRIRPHLERDGVLLFLLAHALLGHEWADQDLAGRAGHCRGPGEAGTIGGWPERRRAPAPFRLPLSIPSDPREAGTIGGWPERRRAPAPFRLPLSIPSDPREAGIIGGWPAVGTRSFIPPTPVPAPGARRDHTPRAAPSVIGRPRHAPASRRSATAHCATRAPGARRARERPGASARPRA